MSVVEPEADPAVAALYDGPLAGWRPIPNWFRSQSTRPDLMAANVRFGFALTANGSLPTSLKQLVILAISIQQGCHYCTAAHRKMARDAGVTDEAIDSLMYGLNVASLPPTQRAVVELALKCAADAQSVTDADMAALRDVGLDDGDLVELILLVGYTRYINIWSDAVAVPIDDMLESH